MILNEQLLLIEVKSPLQTSYGKYCTLPFEGIAASTTLLWTVPLPPAHRLGALPQWQQATAVGLEALE